MASALDGTGEGVLCTAGYSHAEVPGGFRNDGLPLESLLVVPPAHNDCAASCGGFPEALVYARVQFPVGPKLLKYRFDIGSVYDCGHVIFVDGKTKL